MKKERKIYAQLAVFLFIIISIVSCNKDDAQLPLEPTDDSVDQFPTLSDSFVMDTINSFILYNGDDINLEGKITVNGDTLEIETTDSNLVLGKVYSGVLSGKSISLYRTELPIISINTAGIRIPDEPKINGTFLLLENGEDALESYMGIELRGNTSQSFPKKSYNIEFWEDSSGSESKDQELLGMRKDDDWILDGLWNEPLRLRDYVSHALWLKMGRYPYQDLEDITLGIKREFCELFIDQEYTGVYYLSEKIDRKQLQLKKYDEDSQTLRGELYKNDNYGQATYFKSLDPFNNALDIWSGMEAQYPDEVGELDWTNIHAFVDFAISTDKTDFDANIERYLDFENMADYFIFLNVTYAEDNWAKNIITAKYDVGAPYFFLPWDMDGTFGNDHTGKRINITENVIINNALYFRLLDNDTFLALLKSRYNELRSGVLATPEIQDMFNRSYEKLKRNNVYEREALNEDFPFNYSEQEIEFVNTWISQRMMYLDGYFSNL